MPEQPHLIGTRGSPLALWQARHVWARLLAFAGLGEGDLGQELGYPRQYEHPAVVEAMTAIRRICKEHGVTCGHPHVDAQNAAKVIAEGYRFLMAAPVRSFAGLEACRKLTDKG